MEYCQQQCVVMGRIQEPIRLGNGPSKLFTKEVLGRIPRSGGYKRENVGFPISSVMVNHLLDGEFVILSIDILIDFRLSLSSFQMPVSTSIDKFPIREAYEDVRSDVTDTNW